MTARAGTGRAAARTTSLSGRAVRVGVAIGAGLAARYLAGRAQRYAERRGPIERPGGRGPASRLVDWRRAERLAVSRLRRLPGTLSLAELRAAEPAYAAAMARIVPSLEARLGTDLPGVVDRHSVVDRATWARANLVTLRELIDRLEDQLIVPGRAPVMGTGMAGLANRFLTSQQIGFLLGYLGGRVLGQYDVALLSAEHSPGRLLFVDENVRLTAAQLGVPLDEFRMWIALHETTHAFEMEAHPWVRPYLRERLERQLALFLEEAHRVQTKGLGPLVRRWRSAVGEGGLSGFLSPEERRLLRETQRMMSLLEGFSDWVMDEVGAEMMTDVEGIRRRFEARRSQRRHGLERVIARLTGLDLKLEQYRIGERFVAGVWAAGGEAAIRHLWDGPEALPTDDEFRDPAAWIRRVMPATAARPSTA